MKPSGFTLQKGGVVPTPSKGIRKLPPAVPARCTPVVVASPTSDDSSPEEGDDQHSQSSIKRIPPRVEPRRGGGNQTLMRNGGTGTPPQIPARNNNGPPMIKQMVMSDEQIGLQQQKSDESPLHQHHLQQVSPQQISQQQLSQQNQQIYNNTNPFLSNQSTTNDMVTSPQKTYFINGKTDTRKSGDETVDIEVETPSSSTGTEEDSRKEIGERGVEADAEVSDEDNEADECE